MSQQIEDRSQLDLEPNPFDQSFGASDDKDSKLPSISTLTKQQQSQASERGPGQHQQQEQQQPQQPPNPAQHQLPPTAASAVPTSLRSGPLSPAMLQGPSQQHQNPFEASFAQNNNIKTGLTPLAGGQYQPQSPNAAFFGMNMVQPPALTPNTVNAINGVVASFDGSGRPINPDHQSDAFQNYRNYQPQVKQEGLEPPQQNQQRYERNSGDAAANAANGLFLLSQASRHDQSSAESPEADVGQKRKPDSISAPSPATSNKRRSGGGGGRGRGRRSNAAKREEEEDDDDDDAFEDDDELAMPSSSTRAGSATRGSKFCVRHIFLLT